MPARDHCLTQIYLEFSVLYMAVLHACRSVSSVIACSAIWKAPIVVFLFEDMTKIYVVEIKLFPRTLLSDKKRLLPDNFLLFV